MWTKELDETFLASKEKLIELVHEGVRTFDPQHCTALQTDWSKDGIGYLLLQHRCQCPTTEAPICCPEGWSLVYAGSRFTTPAESRYAPIEGVSLTGRLNELMNSTEQRQPSYHRMFQTWSRNEVCVLIMFISFDLNVILQVTQHSSY